MTLRSVPRLVQTGASRALPAEVRKPGPFRRSDGADPVPRERDLAAGTERPLATYAQLQAPRARDVGLFRRVLGGLSFREYEAAAEAVQRAFGLAK